MADEFHLGTGNWWDSARNRVEITGTPPPPSISTRLNSFDWLPPPPPEMDSVTASGAGVLAANPNLQMMGLGLSSQGMDWNQQLFRGEKSESSFRSILQDDLSSNTSSYQQEESSAAAMSSQEHWRHNQVDSAAAYGLLLSENQQLHHSNYAYSGEFMQSWNKFPDFLRTPQPKHPQPPPPAAARSGSHLQFTNNAPFWNASATMNDDRSGFFPAAQIPSFDEKPKSAFDGTTAKRNSTESSNKRPRNEMPSSLPACNNKVKKEKMGDRITALQQLVSPFGKTDTASVLSEAIECIKFLHEQVGVLSTPYMKNGAPIQHQQNSVKSKDAEGPRHDLRTRGLCLVPVSSTFPVTQETASDFWTPTFGATFR